jgi:hypothetical protein
MPEADSETSLARRGSGLVQLPDLRGCQERGGWGRAGNSERATQRASLGSGASPSLPRTYSVCGFKVSLQVFLLLEFDLARFAGLR